MQINDGSTVFCKAKIEIVKPDRIRIYFLKHHGILDIADEYQRTNDYCSYQAIMKSILDSPDLSN